MVFFVRRVCRIWLYQKSKLLNNTPLGKRKREGERERKREREREMSVSSE
jgi:hypothetical protein